MRDLWWWFSGFLRVRLTGADPERSLGILSERIRLEAVDRISDLTVEFTVPRFSRKILMDCAEHRNDRVEILLQAGFPEVLRKLRYQPLLTFAVVFLLAMSVFLPGHILFFRVEGNRNVPDRLILEEAANCGLAFGADRETLRSEQIKNQLLARIPGLSWVGINTAGCVATVTVRERETEEVPASPVPGNLIAAVDGIVTSVVVNSGTPLCSQGDVVTQGQVLISGYTDLGLCTHVEAASGEVYALTHRETGTVLPAEIRKTVPNGNIVKKYSLIFGKKRINLHSDSGILHTGCGKMTQIRVLRLPGGWTLPAQLVIETYVLSDGVPSERSESSALAMLEQASGRQISQNMIAGEILDAESAFFREDGIFRLIQSCRCREMIARFSSGIRTEGEYNDGKNGER